MNLANLSSIAICDSLIVDDIISYYCFDFLKIMLHMLLQQKV
jgi:hypothetical protein